jgi:HK97 family phage portal protein
VTGGAARQQPPNTISSVDEDQNWFSPFQPILPFGPPYVTNPRDWDYEVGENLNYAPRRFMLFQRLRDMSQTWGILRTIIETRKDQLMAQPWEIQQTNKPRSTSPRVEEIKQFFRRPDGKRRYSAWARMLLEDLFVIDAPTLYVGDRDRAGRPLRIDVIDGATIRPLIDDAGRIPDWPNPAYQQITKGLPMLNFTERELIYAPMRPRPEMPIWGYSPVEHIYLEIMEAIKKTFYQLEFWTEGTLPDMIMSVPKDWTAKQIVAFQAVFDATLSGNTRQKSKVRFVPEGMKPYDIKNSSGEALHSTRDDTLIRLACYAFSVPPTPFMSTMNRATAQSSADESQQEGLMPLKVWWREEIMNRIIQEEFGYDDVEFAWQPVVEVDQLKRAQIYQIYQKSAIQTPNEIRQDLGLLPVADGDSLLVFTNNGVMTLTDAVAAGKAQATSMTNGGSGPLGSEPRPTPTGSKPQGENDQSPNRAGTEPAET